MIDGKDKMGNFLFVWLLSICLISIMRKKNINKHQCIHTCTFFIFAVKKTNLREREDMLFVEISRLKITCIGFIAFM